MGLTVEMAGFPLDTLVVKNTFLEFADVLPVLRRAKTCPAAAKTEDAQSETEDVQSETEDVQSEWTESDILSLPASNAWVPSTPDPTPRNDATVAACAAMLLSYAARELAPQYPQYGAGPVFLQPVVVPVYCDAALDSRPHRRRTARPEQGQKIFVGGLGPHTTGAQVRTYFEQFGHVLDAAVLADATTRCSRGFGFVEFAGAIPALVLGRSHWIDSRRCGVRAYDASRPGRQAQQPH